MATPAILRKIERAGNGLSKNRGGKDVVAARRHGLGIG